MSGGAYEYLCFKLEDVASRVKGNNDHPAIRRRISEYLKCLGNIMHEVEWEDSGDGGDWIKVRKELRAIEKLGKLDEVKLDKARKFDMIKEIVEEI